MLVSALADFLPYTVSQKSASLILTESEANTNETLTALKDAGFKHLSDIPDLGKAGKYYLTASDYVPNFLYDLLVQYGSGQISLYNSDAGASWVNPAYSGSSFIVLMSKESLEKIEMEGVRLRESVGLALQI